MLGLKLTFLKCLGPNFETKINILKITNLTSWVKMKFKPIFYFKNKHKENAIIKLKEKNKRLYSCCQWR